MVQTSTVWIATWFRETYQVGDLKIIESCCSVYVYGHVPLRLGAHNEDAHTLRRSCQTETSRQQRVGIVGEHPNKLGEGFSRQKLRPRRSHGMLKSVWQCTAASAKHTRGFMC